MAVITIKKILLNNRETIEDVFYLGDELDLFDEIEFNKGIVLGSTRDENACIYVKTSEISSVTLAFTKNIFKKYQKNEK